jgi:hypothetical protein
MPFSKTHYHVNVNIWQEDSDRGHLFEPFVAATPEDAEKWVVDRVETLSNALGESYEIRATFFPDIID